MQFSDQVDSGAPGGGAPGRAAARLESDASNFRTECHDFLQQGKEGRRISLAMEVSARVLTHATMNFCKLRDEAWIAVGSRHQRIYDRYRYDADHDRRAALHAGVKYVLGLIDLLYRDDSNSVAG
ncbi:hypothetical protein H8A95_04650 [Bradyrhizobium sp. Pear76]|nr:hypothetical protein [Bradyrhizobium oropedii]MCC8961627.1 hypothetical protein [Bradyrhizobium oropedii]